MSFQIKQKNNITYGEFSEFIEQKIFTAVSFRPGGVSSSPFDSLNMGLHTEDIKIDVLKNRELFFNSQDIDHQDIVTLKQAHSNKVVIVQKKDKGRGALDHKDSLAEADGMATNEPEIPLVIFTADCVSIFLADVKKRVAGIAHAGWKGTFFRIGESIIKAMKKLGADPNNMIAGFGPSIGPCCYEVGQDFAEKFNNEFILYRDKKYYFDLKEANKKILVSAGMKEDNIIHSDLCTSCRSDICFSYRRSNKTGRMASVIML